MSMGIDRHAVTAQECVPEVVSRLWPEVVPMHAISIVDCINGDGRREIIVITDSEQPPWVLLGLLAAVKSDVETDWSGTITYPYVDDEEDQDEDEDYDDEEDEDDEDD